MKRLIMVLAVVVAGSVFGTHHVFAGKGNGAPSGPHYDLNIHGLQKGGSYSTGSNGHDIFVPLTSSGDSASVAGCDDIQLTQWPTFQVLSPDCRTASNPQFGLPCIAVTATCSSSQVTVYSVWARAIAGKGTANMNTCYQVTVSGTTSTYCLMGTALVLNKKTSGGKFTDVTNQLLYFCDAATNTLQPIFGNSTYTYFWDYDNQGLRLAQLRFYYVGSTAPAPTGKGCTTTLGF
jgi:hypothetical protein